MSKLMALNDNGSTIILITHDNKLANIAKRVITIKDGHVVSDENIHQSRRDEVIKEVTKI